MNIIKKIVTLIMAPVIALTSAACVMNPAGQDDDGTFNIVTSFYPMQILVMNIAGGIDGVSVECMSEPDIGCIHDHVFSTSDLRMVENADVFVENGLELELFNDQIKSAYPDLVIIEASEDVTDAPSDGDEVNGHVWTSPADYIIQIDTVARALSAADPGHAAEYEANAREYAGRIEELIGRNEDAAEILDGMRVLVLDETLPSFCEYFNMDYITLETDHEQSALSAGDLRDVIGSVNDNGIAAIFVTADGENDIADTIAGETGAVIYELNSCMTGEVYADAYIDQMAENFETLRGVAG